MTYKQSWARIIFRRQRVTRGPVVLPDYQQDCLSRGVNSGAIDPSLVLNERRGSCPLFSGKTDSCPALLNKNIILIWFLNKYKNYIVTIERI